MAVSLLQLSAEAERSWRRVVRRAGRRDCAPARSLLLIGLLGILLIAGSPAVAAANGPCEVAIAVVEPASHLPPGLLSAIGLAESARIDPVSHAAIAWPWTIDAGGVGQAFETREAAMAAVLAAQQSGVQSIDIGCMQINLVYHPHAFADLAEAFDPAANVRYAAEFLAALHTQRGDWASAVAAYHSATPQLGAIYMQRVAALWPQASRFGLSTDAALLPAVLEAEVDPNHVFTPEFRAQMVEAAAFRHRREASARPDPAAPPVVARVRVAQSQGTRAKARTVADLEAEVDPEHVMTSEFRAQMVAVAAARHTSDGIAVAAR